MPLPMMAGDPATMLMQPGMQGAPPPTPASASMLPGGGVPPDQGSPTQADPRSQARGAVELVSQVRTTVTSQLEGLARQFPGAAKSANQAALMLDRALQDVVRDILSTLQTPEPAAPTLLH